MERNRFLIVALLFLMTFAVTSATTATAQELLRSNGDAWSIDGEPTDLEGVLTIVGENTLEENDIDTTIPVEESEFESWLDRLLDLLIDLGLMAQ